MKEQSTPDVASKSNLVAGSINRRSFIGEVASAAIGLTIVPAHVMGGNLHIPPSDRIHVAYIGTGTQGLRELPDMLKNRDVQVVAVCDPQRNAMGYRDWNSKGLLTELRTAIDNPNWNCGGDNRIPGGLNNGQEIVDAYYARNHPDGKFKCAAYTDFREMLEKEKDIDAVKIMATDHLHGVMAAAAIRRGIHITMHKPVANRLEEGYKIIEMAKKSDVITHLIPWESNGSMEQVMAWINGGVIGKLCEVHNWSSRPVWPQYHVLPADKPELPDGFNWDLWLGPEAERPYHPNYTNMVFRGWYDFGGGAMADMGHYSLWSVFRSLELENPEVVEPCLSHLYALRDDATSFKIQNTDSFPMSSSVRFKYPAKGNRPAVDLIWYDGGMRPPVPGEFYDQNLQFPAEGLMFVGDKGKILSSAFTLIKPYVLSGDKMKARELDLNVRYEKASGVQRFIEGIKNNRQTDGSFRNAWPITEAVNLYAAALRAGKILKYDATKRQITNVPEANVYLSRKYRKGWSPEEV